MHLLGPANIYMISDVIMFLCRLCWQGWMTRFKQVFTDYRWKTETTSGRQRLNHIWLCTSHWWNTEAKFLLRQAESLDADSFSLYIVDYSPSSGKLMVWMSLRASVANHCTIGHSSVNRLLGMSTTLSMNLPCFAPRWACLGVVNLLSNFYVPVMSI